MQGFGAGPGAPGQTRDITKGGYPGAGGGSKGQVSPQAMPLGKTFTQRPTNQTQVLTPLAMSHITPREGGYYGK